MKKFLCIIFAIALLTGCNTSTAPEATETPTIPHAVTASPEETPIRVQISPQSESKAHGLTEVATADCGLVSKMDTITLYTSATKSNGRFVWDDHARWLLEIVTDAGEGPVYTLYDTEVSNGSIYFDVIRVKNKPYILLRNISTASDYVKVFTFDEGFVYETEELNLNEMKDEVINLIYSSVPNYR